VSWSDDVPHSRDGSPNWAADTDPVGSVTPELALVDPGLARGGNFNSEVAMSSMQFGDGTLRAPEPDPAPAQQVQQVQPVQPLEPIPTLAPVAPPVAPQVAPPAPAEPVPALSVGDMRDVPLGTLLFRAGLLPEEKLEEALQEGIKSGKRLGEILLERGLVSENDLGRLLAGQKGLPFVELDPNAIDPTAPPLLHSEKARLHGALPVGFEGGVPVVAVADPSNDLVVENVRRALNCEPVLVVAGRDALYRAIDAAYGGQVEAPAQSVAEAPVVAAEPALPVVEPAPPVVEPIAVEPVAQVVEPVAQVVEPLAPPPAPDPVVPQPVVVEPVEPVAAEPFLAQPAPVEPVPAEPVAVEPVVPEPVAEAAPAIQIEPLATQPVQNGDGLFLGQVQHDAAPPVAEAPAEPVQPVEPVQAIQPEAQPEPPAAPTPEPVPQSTWAVEVRLANGEKIEVGVHATREQALEGAREVVAHASANGAWPFVAGRFVRPDAIISVDLAELDPDRWLGSSARAAWGEKPQS
jgi:hypothetical protein